MTEMLDPAQVHDELRQKRYNATVVSARKVHADLMIIRVQTRLRAPRPPPRPILHPRPRQLGAASSPAVRKKSSSPGDEQKVVRRAYSMSCSMLSPDGGLVDADAEPFIEFYISLVREGGDPTKPPALTPRLFMLHEGERIAVGEKVAGHYTLEPLDRPRRHRGLPRHRHRRSAAQLHALGTCLSAATAARSSRAVACGSRRIWRTPTRTTNSCKRYPNYRYIRLATREPESVGAKVYIQDLITSGQLADAAGGKLDPAHAPMCSCAAIRR